MCGRKRNNYGGRRGLVGSMMDPQQGQPTGGYADPYCDNYSGRGSCRRGRRGGPLTGGLMGLMGDSQNNHNDQRRRNGPGGLLVAGVMSLMNGRQSSSYQQRQNNSYVQAPSNPYDQRQVDAQRPRDVDPREREVQRSVRDVPVRQSPRELDSKTKDDMFGSRSHGDDESDHDDRAEREYERHIRNIVAQQSQEQQFAPPPGPPPSYQAAIRGS
ncbi:hypothetical protein PV11_09758 [Exophiala sideris]|uniref:Uncharacterized protein n=1 Tax=Exophiala sideris TaxID=1016849 RepID=A0A0D1Y584_9EURO|nr:hypothetical protein PV11_09758 [Exophiala sideris]